MSRANPFATTACCLELVVADTGLPHPLPPLAAAIYAFLGQDVIMVVDTGGTKVHLLDPATGKSLGVSSANVTKEKWKPCDIVPFWQSGVPGFESVLGLTSYQGKLCLVPTATEDLPAIPEFLQQTNKYAAADDSTKYSALLLNGQYGRIKSGNLHRHAFDGSGVAFFTTTGHLSNSTCLVQRKLDGAILVDDHSLPGIKVLDSDSGNVVSTHPIACLKSGEWVSSVRMGVNEEKILVCQYWTKLVAICDDPLTLTNWRSLDVRHEVADAVEMRTRDICVSIRKLGVVIYNSSLVLKLTIPGLDANGICSVDRSLGLRMLETLRKETDDL